jgi:alkyldihydroxyacetonephosphate synthase
MKWWGWGDPNKEFNVDNRPGFWPFVNKVLGRSDFKNIPQPSFEQIVLPNPRIDEKCLTALKEVLAPDQIETSKQARLDHCYGKSFRDLLRVLENKITHAPDIVVYPNSHDDVVAIMRIAMKFKATIIPYGGGTNIAGGLDVIPDEKNMVISVDMQRMNKVLRIDKESMLAEIEAGVLGKSLEEQLNKQGVTLGHFPDSFEFSSLGGWVVTRSAGMQSDYYGNIENMVIALTFVSPLGEIQTREVPRASVGPDINEIILGSEGIFGILTKITVRISKLEPKEMIIFLYPNFESAIDIIQQCIREDNNPMMFRVSNPLETGLSFAMSPKSSALEHFVKQIFTAYLSKVKKFDMTKVCLSVVSFYKKDAAKIKHFKKIAAQHGAVDLGKGPVKKWSESKYDYPYIRDFLLNYGLVVDVTETSTTWANIMPLYTKVHDAMDLFFKDNANGMGYFGCHLSHSYKTGACLYFTFAFYSENSDTLAVYLKAKKYIVETIIKNGGALSHHHAIGMEHMPWMSEYLDETSINVFKGLKNTFDPNNICNPGKLIPDNNVIAHFWNIR